MDTYTRKGTARIVADGALAVLISLITPLLEKNPRWSTNSDHEDQSGFNEVLGKAIELTRRGTDRVLD